MNAKATAIETT